VARSALDIWVDRASDLLWEPGGAETRDWLVARRRLPEEVLRAHRIGASAFTVSGNSSSPVAVLPVISKGQAIFVQFRLIDPPAGADRYRPHGSEGRRPPTIGLYRPLRQRHPEIIVTEGIIDALSANTAGYRAVAVLDPGFAVAETAMQLSRLAGPLVLALDPDTAGDSVTNRLAVQLWAHDRRPALLAAMGSDLNDAMVAAGDWPRKLAAHVRDAVTNGPPDRPPPVRDL
jgi:hypothetical protein